LRRGHLKIAIASTGLGHVRRGVETWARDTAAALHARGADITLFSAASEPEAPYEVPVSCLRRGAPASSRVTDALPGFTWRLGVKNPYALEQTTFWFHLWPLLRRGDFDVLHVQDPQLAWWCRGFRRRGMLRTREILGHGTEEPLAFLKHFPFVQHLAPWHLAEARRELAAEIGAHWCTLPNFVDIERFAPVSSREDQRRLRAALSVPEDALVIGTAAAIKRTHKRIDYLLEEVASFVQQHPASSICLVVAGAAHADTPALAAAGREMLGETQVCFLPDFPPGQMPDLYRCFDVFALASLKEMMPIAVLEALASGLPLLVNAHPVLEWMGGTGCRSIDMSAAGALAAALGEADSAWRETVGAAARHEAESRFAADVVAQQYVDYYGEVCATTL
jgi:glycosyltransferase involved in cell wall biosynthesis